MIPLDELYEALGKIKYAYEKYGKSSAPFEDVLYNISPLLEQSNLDLVVLKGEILLTPSNDVVEESVE